MGPVGCWWKSLGRTFLQKYKINYHKEKALLFGPSGCPSFLPGMRTGGVAARLQPWVWKPPTKQARQGASKNLSPEKSSKNFHTRCSSPEHLITEGKDPLIAQAALVGLLLLVSKHKLKQYKTSTFEYFLGAKALYLSATISRGTNS